MQRVQNIGLGCHGGDPRDRSTPGARLADDNTLTLSPEDVCRLRMSRTTSQNRRRRNEATKEITSSVAHKESGRSKPSSSKFDGTESARVLATERLRLQAETAQSQNIVMKLSLDGDHFIWINYAWRGVTGCVFDKMHVSCRHSQVYVQHGP